MKSKLVGRWTECSDTSLYRKKNYSNRFILRVDKIGDRYYKIHYLDSYGRELDHRLTKGYLYHYYTIIEFSSELSRTLIKRLFQR